MNTDESFKLTTRGLFAGVSSYVILLTLALALLAAKSAYEYKSETFLSAARLLNEQNSPQVSAQDAANYLNTILIPSGSFDTHWWVINAQRMVALKEWRCRFTQLDNSPDGREVHWSSLPAWLLILAGHSIHFVTDLPLNDSIAMAAYFVGPWVLFVLVLLFSAIAARRFGWAAGGVLALIMVSTSSFTTMFRATEADHHGIAAALALGSLLALIAAVVELNPSGRLTEEAARNWFRTSGVLGGAALWISTSSTVPFLAGIAGGGLLGAWLNRRTQTASYGMPERRVQGSLWQSWSRWGASVSFLFYLLEYFPSHMGIRLEVNHPLYSLAWLGGGEIIKRILDGLQGSPPVRTRRDTVVALLAVIALAIVPTLVATVPSLCFWVRDPFLASLHIHFIQEFASISSHLSKAGWSATLFLITLFPLLLIPTVVFLFSKRVASGLRMALSIVLVVSLTSLSLGCIQIRWLLQASAAFIALAFLIAVVLNDMWKAKAINATFLRVIAGLWLVVILFHPAGALFGRYRSLSSVATMRLGDWRTLAMREIAWKLRRGDEEGTPVVLAGPNVTTQLIYYGGFRGLGTLYWENRDGLRATASIYSARTETEVQTRLADLGVTHIFLCSWNAFEIPYTILERGMNVSSKPSDGFISQCLSKRELPRWLRPMRFDLSPIAALADNWAIALLVKPDQSISEAKAYLAAFDLDANRDPEGVLAIATEIAVNHPEVKIARSLRVRALIALERLSEAFDCVERAEPDDQPALLESLANESQRKGDDHTALKALQRASFLSQKNTDYSARIALILSSSPIDSLRDREEAFSLTTRLVEQSEGKSGMAILAHAASLWAIGRREDAETALSESELPNSSAENESQLLAFSTQLKSAFDAKAPIRFDYSLIFPKQTYTSGGSRWQITSIEGKGDRNNSSLP